MDFEQAYEKTLAKWREFAAGKWASPAEDCGLCKWAKKRRCWPFTTCYACPAYHHYGRRSCAPLHLLKAVARAYEADDMPKFQHYAQLVVEELLSIKDSLFEWAKRLDSDDFTGCGHYNIISR